jgi:hypothetical protein
LETFSFLLNKLLIISARFQAGDFDLPLKLRESIWHHHMSYYFFSGFLISGENFRSDFFHCYERFLSQPILAAFILLPRPDFRLFLPAAL